MVEDHRHCIVCGKPTPPEKYICSPSCEEIFKRQQAKLRKTRILNILLLLTFVLVLMLVSILRSGGT